MGLLESGLIKTIRIIGGRLNRAFTVIKNIIASERERERESYLDTGIFLIVLNLLA